MSHRLNHKPEREKVSSEFEPSSPGRNESGEETFDAAHSREELENLQRGEKQQPCELGELSLGLLTEGSCRQRAGQSSGCSSLRRALVRRAGIKSSSRCNSCCSGPTAIFSP